MKTHEDDIQVAVIQWSHRESAPLHSSSEVSNAYLDRSRNTYAELIRQAAGGGARLIVTPEFAIPGYPSVANGGMYQTTKELLPFAETVPGPSSLRFSELAREIGAYLHVGIAEYDISDDAIYNTVLVISPEGNLLGRYRKNNLFREESRILKAGHEMLTYQTPWGRVSPIICADSYSGKVISNLARIQPDVVTISASWVVNNGAMAWYRAVAKTTNSIVLGANQSYFPDSGVVNPDGSPQSHIRQSQGIAYGWVPISKNHER